MTPLEVALRFPDLHPALGSQAAAIEASRCLYCFDAPCMAACPTHIDVPKFIKKIASANLRGSAATILDSNVLGLSCSRVCPVDVLCEGACVMHRYNKQPIEIGRLQRHAMDHFYAHSPSLPVGRPTGKRIACVGAGPASLACAAELRKHGHAVTIFERQSMPGGLNTHGIAEYKIRPRVSIQETELVGGMGVEFKLGIEVDPISLENEFDAIFIGIGLGVMNRLDVPGENLPGVVDALTFIAEYKLRTPQVGRTVVVIGAGNTAIDAAVAAKKLGAERVHIFYRRGEPDMSAFAKEFEHAKQAPVRFHYFRKLDEILGDTKVEGVRFNDFKLSCDMVIPAIGQSKLREFGEVNRATGQTSNPKFFAGGDCVNGGREVVDAVADGKRAALGIVKWLT
jgi:dihydropyrimidine dehydrogenase (NAD+) subunit PreT